MRIERRQGSDERRVITGMLVDPVVLGRVAARWSEEGLFASKWANLLGRWAVSYYRDYGDAPKSNIVGIYQSWAEANKDKDTADLVERFLQSLSDEYETQAEAVNPAMVIDLAGRLFNRVHASRVVELVQGNLDTGGDGEVQKILAGYNRIELGGGEGVDLFTDPSVIDAAFSEPVESLVKYPGPLGDFIGDAFCRDSFVSFMGPEKRGKTWWLIDLAFRAVSQRRRVAFFEAGDMSLNQIARRFGQRAARLPKKAGVIRIPTSMERADDSPEEDDADQPRNRRSRTRVGDDGGLAVMFEEREVDGCDKAAAKAAFARLMERKAKSRDSLFKLSCHSNGSLSVNGIKATLQDWERQGWTADLVIIDYADILASPLGQLEGRDAINANWKAMRALSQENHCCVVTATQADAASYNTDTLGRQHFSEDKRKYAHVTAMIGLNSTDAEKKQGRQRLNFLVLREDDFIATNVVHVAGCLAIGNPAMLSCF